MSRPQAILGVARAELIESSTARVVSVGEAVAHAQVQFPVNRELAGLAEAFPANSANERFLPGVCVNMLFEILAEDERLIAVIALEWALIEMRRGVSSEGEFSGEAFVAVGMFTAERLSLH